jgi:hypothetical protein
MSRKHPDVSSLVPLLKSIIERWPKTGAESLQDVQNALRENLAAGFDPLDLHNRVTAVAELEEVDTRIDDRAMVDFYDVDRWPQRAIFELSTSGAWKLKSLKFQCPVCFGSGENDGATCSICGGSGWGSVLSA